MITVEEVLSNNKIHFKSGEDRLVIRCLSPSHEDKHPSMVVNKTTGDCQCFSCGHQVNVYKLFNVEFSQANAKVMKMLRIIDDLRDTQLKLPDGCSPYVGDYRGVSQDTYDTLGAFLNPTLFKDKICFPIYGWAGELRGIVHRDMFSNKVRYGTYPRGCGLLPMYPLKHYVPTKNTLILVEGLFDAVNMHSLGFKNTLCMFGTSTYKGLYKDLMTFIKVNDISEVVVAFDNDEAGKSTSDNLVKLLSDKGDFNVAQFDWSAMPTKLKDFGELKSDHIFDVYNILYGAK